jgi:Stress responsive A/B Barrel Domain
VIRNIVLVKLKPGQDPAVVAKAQQAFLDLNCPGTLSYVIGDDLGLREGNWSFVIVADFTGAEAYRAYDQDPAHNQARRAHPADRADRQGSVRDALTVHRPAECRSGLLEWTCGQVYAGAAGTGAQAA